MAKQIKTKTKAKTKKASRKAIPSVGKAYVFSGYNNTIVSVTDIDGNVICWSSSGTNSFKGSRKSTPFAATIVGEDVAKKASAMGVKEVSAYIKGIGAGKSQAVKALRNGGLIITKIIDVTPVTHNGCRAKKRRRQ